MEDPPPAPELISCQCLEQFLLLAKTARGPAVAELIKQALGAPGVYVFSELLETECVKEVASGPHANYVRLLEIFAYGTYADYKSKNQLTSGAGYKFYPIPSIPSSSNPPSFLLCQQKQLAIAIIAPSGMALLLCLHIKRDSNPFVECAFGPDLLDYL